MKSAILYGFIIAAVLIAIACFGVLFWYPWKGNKRTSSPDGYDLISDSNLSA